VHRILLLQRGELLPSNKGGHRSLVTFSYPRSKEGEQIRAVVVDPSMPGRLAIREVSLRDPDRDEVGVRVTAISLNRGETPSGSISSRGCQGPLDVGPGSGEALRSGRVLRSFLRCVCTASEEVRGAIGLGHGADLRSTGRSLTSGANAATVAPAFHMVTQRA
jgi:hypothetical protein